MKESFISLIRLPDNIKIQTEDSPLRFEEKGAVNAADARIRCDIKEGVLALTLLPGSSPVKFVRLRFRGDLSAVRLVMGDAWDRAGDQELQWRTMVPHLMMPWYMLTSDGERTHGYGVKTGCNCTVNWQCDPSGITLWLDVRNGSGGVQLTEPLMCCEVICREGRTDETAYHAAQDFCRMMCPNPKLPKETVYGFNNWYWAYGITDRKCVVDQAAMLNRLCAGNPVKPYMVMDDGWQYAHAKGSYNGGPWEYANERFGSMQAVAEEIKAKGCKAGLWFRPLRTMADIPEEASYRSPWAGPGKVLDPTHPFSLEQVFKDTRRIAEWGYDLIKHDFTAEDLFAGAITDKKELRFYDRSLTNAQILKNLYQVIQRAAGNSIVIGCNTLSHITAGIHAVQRVGYDTSGRSFEWTRRYGVHSLMRLPQNMAFYQIDPDCAAFTGRVSADVNLDFLEAMAISGCASFASVQPGILTLDAEERMAAIFKTASETKPADFAEPIDWDRTGEPSVFAFMGEERRYDWYKEYDGARSILTWLE